jgi:DNA adenine methylase
MAYIGGAWTDIINPLRIYNELANPDSVLRRRVTDVLKGVRKNFSPSARKVLAEYGDSPISYMMVHRKPIQSAIHTAFQLVTLGQWNNARAQTNQDRLFHLGLVLGVVKDGKVQPILVEKNEVINVAPTNPEGGESMPTPEPKQTTLNQFLENGLKAVGPDRFFTYDPFQNNCQDFVSLLLNANGGMSPEVEAFVKQPIDQLVKRIPGWTNAIARSITDLGAVANVALEGGKVVDVLHGCGLHDMAYGMYGGCGSKKCADCNLRPILCRMGSKYMLRNMIVPLIPEHTTYIEPFVGTGAIFFNKPKAEKNVLNDLDNDTYSFLKNLQKAPLDVTTYPESKTVEGHKALWKKPQRTIQDKLVHQMIRTCSGFISGVMVREPKHIYSSPSIHNKVKRIGELKEKLKGVKITKEDYAKVIQKHDGANAFIFLDPPYENTDKPFGYAEDKGFDFQRLAEVLSKVKGKFLMTINDSPEIRAIFKQFHQRPFKPITRMITTRHATGTKTYERKELFVSNYKLPVRGGRTNFQRDQYPPPAEREPVPEPVAEPELTVEQILVILNLIAEGAHDAPLAEQREFCDNIYNVFADEAHEMLQHELAPGETLEQRVVALRTGPLAQYAGWLYIVLDEMMADDVMGGRRMNDRGDSPPPPERMYDPFHPPPLPPGMVETNPLLPPEPEPEPVVAPPEKPSQAETIPIVNMLFSIADNSTPFSNAQLRQFCDAVYALFRDDIHEALQGSLGGWDNASGYMVQASQDPNVQNYASLLMNIIVDEIYPGLAYLLEVE